MTFNLAELTELSEETKEKILKELLTTENLEIKTDIPNPLAITRLKILSIAIKKEFERLGIDRSKSGDALEDTILWLLTYRISYQRQSRKEIIDAYKALISRHDDKTITDKLVGK